MRPPLFTGVGEPVDAENWLLRIEKILEGMQCPVDRRVTFATFALDGEAERWWRGQSLEKFGGRTASQILWEDFVKVIRDSFVPPARSQMQERFMRLVQGDRTVMQYEAEFTTLSRYASQIIATTEDKCQKFLSGLRGAIRQPLIPFSFDDYAVLVEKAKRIEIDFQTVQKRRDFQQKRKGFGKTRSFQTHSGGSSVKKIRIDSSESSSSARTCDKCGKMHRGECLSGSNVCFFYHQPGHVARNCPKDPREGRSSAPPPQQSTGRHSTNGRPRSQESTASASVPSHPVARPVMQPRVYAITQQEAKESPDMITGIIHVKCFPNRVLFDTGASHSFISQEFIKKHALDICTMPTALSILLLNGSSMTATLMFSTFLTI
ncbi:hypothetical protein MA16_Dca006090 [Dendrobium catenatum]|uniref:Retrotransposon gag domain-containing protein n=1 Tax=Dendrobium catenatum TaxID=906689 RepID=A0A2I0X4G2_9ASPA|nr:hypothetical protein MA16_Dca006090 [Dendrobium catenatum]